MYRSPANKSAGTALVVVLTFLIILSGLVVAFMEFSKWDLQTAQASAKKLQSQEIALGGGDAAAALLLEEIVTNSDLNGPAVNGVNLYYPKEEKNAFPENALTTSGTLLPSLIKSSRDGLKPFANGASNYPASPISTSVASGNGRALDFEFWNAPKLNFQAAASSFQSAAMPDWILVTKGSEVKRFPSFSNSMKDPASPDFVIGRYAYTVYDVSGLLDITVAGGPKVSQSNEGWQDQAVLDMKSKPSLAYADISQIPGVTDAAAFVAWRNANSGKTPAAFRQSVLSNEWTLRESGVSPTGDNALFSRKDLIQAAQQSGTGLTVDSLPYLTTFTRMKNAPSWRPSVNFAAPYNYKTRSDQDSAVNRNLAWVRVKDEFVRRDGTLAKTGTPLVNQRFPMSRLQLLTRTALSTSGTTEIGKYFGLTRSTAGAPWIYNHGEADRILTLAEVADEKREPDLPELLQATILNGSLASGDPSRSATVIEDEKTLQILEIFANMVDQQDSDNFPTVIRFTGQSGQILEAVGKERLPYLVKLIAAAGDVPAATGATDAHTRIFLFPQLSQRQAIIEGQIVGEIPRLRVRFTGQAQTEFRDKVTGIISNMVVHPVNDEKTLTPGLNFDRVPSLLTNTTVQSVSADTVGRISLKGNRVGFQLPDVPRPVGSEGYVQLEFIDLNVIMQFRGDDGVWRPYSRINGIHRYAVGGGELASEGFDATVEWEVPNTPITDPSWEERSVAFPVVKSDELSSMNPVVCQNPGGLPLIFAFSSTSIQKPSATGPAWIYGSIPAGPDMLYSGSMTLPANWTQRPGGFSPADLTLNLRNYSSYTDLDGETRRADGANTTHTTNGIIPTDATKYSPTEPPTDPVSGGSYRYNRPFRTPAEMGAVSRGQPWRTLNFWTEDTPDSGLLDLFSVRDEPIVTGSLNPNTRLAPVLMAAMAGSTAHLHGFRSTLSVTSPLGPMSEDVIAHTKDKKFVNRAELSEIAGTAFSRYQSNSKETTEQVARALSEISNTRTWNVLIDVVGQAGRYPPSATAFKDFQVQSETRYWIHLAIDRYTGEIVDKKIEPVTD